METKLTLAEMEEQAVANFSRRMGGMETKLTRAEMEEQAVADFQYVVPHLTWPRHWRNFRKCTEGNEKACSKILKLLAQDFETTKEELS